MSGFTLKRRVDAPDLIAVRGGPLGGQASWGRGVCLVPWGNPLGAAGLPLGAQLMVDGAVQIAARLGIPNTVVGVSIVAIGKSLPELATTVVAALHRHTDVAVGNILGSNLFNILAIMRLTAMVAPAPVPVPAGFLRFRLLVMPGAALVLAALAWFRGGIGRGAGVALLTSYAL